RPGWAGADDWVGGVGCNGSRDLYLGLGSTDAVTLQQQPFQGGTPFGDGGSRGFRAWLANGLAGAGTSGAGHGAASGRTHGRTSRTLARARQAIGGTPQP